MNTIANLENIFAGINYIFFITQKTLMFEFILDNIVNSLPPFIISGPMVDSIILSMAEPRSEEVEAVESDTIIPPSDTALECTRTCGDSDTSTDWVTVETLETLVDCATEEESGRWRPRTSVLELVSGMNTCDSNRPVRMRKETFRTLVIKKTLLA